MGCEYVKDGSDRETELGWRPPFLYRTYVAMQYVPSLYIQRLGALAVCIIPTNPFSGRLQPPKVPMHSDNPVCCLVALGRSILR